MTNSEWLKNLSDEELAELLSDICYNSESGNCRLCIMKKHCDRKQPHYGIRDWLKAKHEVK